MGLRSLALFYNSCQIFWMVHFIRHYRKEIEGSIFFFIGSILLTFSLYIFLKVVTVVNFTFLKKRWVDWEIGISFYLLHLSSVHNLSYLIYELQKVLVNPKFLLNSPNNQDRVCFIRQTGSRRKNVDFLDTVLCLFICILQPSHLLPFLPPHRSLQLFTVSPCHHLRDPNE